MTTIVFDTETTGLPKASSAPIDTQPYITEYCGYKLDDDGNLIDKLSFLVKVPIPVSSFITNLTGIDDELLADEKPFIEVVDDLKKFCLGAERWVAHNIEFDINMLTIELRRLGMARRFPWPCEHFCTMVFQGRKRKLGVLYQHLFGESFADAHRAEPDVIALTRCYLEMIKR